MSEDILDERLTFWYNPFRNKTYICIDKTSNELFGRRIGISGIYVVNDSTSRYGEPNGAPIDVNSI